MEFSERCAGYSAKRTCLESAKRFARRFWRSIILPVIAVITTAGANTPLMYVAEEFCTAAATVTRVLEQLIEEDGGRKSTIDRYHQSLHRLSGLPCLYPNGEWVEALSTTRAPPAKVLVSLGISTAVKNISDH